MASKDFDTSRKRLLPIRRLQSVLPAFALLYLSVYIPIAGVLYFPFWFDANCHWHDRCQRFGEQKAADRIDELTAYMRHMGDLSSSDWTLKEKWHLEEVRGIFDALFFAGLAAAGVLISLFNAKTLRRAGLANIGIMLCLCAILPFFGFFWRDIFHEWLFDNAHWKNNPGDVSYYIMPRVFFKHTMMLIIGVSALINAGVFMGLLKRRKQSTK
ncbi:MAG: DUF1461 domain-containing protein [Desulfobacterales bacterium]